ncbi:hypothetical protein AVEN_231417-1 [Araneus ventricosus]|uniref:Uncharacterized protein n=1 Tax=Araneus ventricosus TaxID=182803 RepID=A0A4Y2M3C1_ARAVE|nr:hypothetical protein AVEN_231417-1 [Araneus ventricosus]
MPEWFPLVQISAAVPFTTSVLHRLLALQAYNNLVLVLVRGAESAVQSTRLDGSWMNGLRKRPCHGCHAIIPYSQNMIASVVKYTGRDL